MNAPDKRILTLGTAALVAAATAALVVAVASRRSPSDADQAALEAQSSSNLDSMQDALTRSIADRTRSDAQARIDSPHGQALFRLCAEWTDFHENHPGADTARQRDAACSRFRIYIDEGIDAGIDPGAD